MTAVPAVDVAVVGGGILGCLVAGEVLARAPGSSVLLLERDCVGGGASARSAGLHFPRGRTARVRRMSVYSQEFYAKLRAADPASPIHPVAATLVSTTDIVTLRETYTGALTESGAGAWRLADCHHADVRGLVHALARKLRPAAWVREGVRVTDVRPGRDGVTLRLSTGATVAAGRVVLAPGPWVADPAWRTLTDPIGARVKRIVAVHLESEPAPDARAVVYHDEDAFLLPLPDRGHWLFSYTCQEWDVGPDSPATGLTSRHLRQAGELLGRYAPDLRRACLSGRMFYDAYSTDGQPVVRPLDSAGRVVFAGAASGSGYRLAPAIAADAADLLDLPHGTRSAT